MKRLLLIRHAKTEPAGLEESDHERQLTERGVEDAGKLARAIARAGVSIDAALVSSATRCRQTWDLMKETLGEPAEFVDRRLYLASADTILDLARVRAEETVAVIGHNPGLAILGETLVGEDALPEQRMRTGSAILIVFDGARVTGSTPFPRS